MGSLISRILPGFHARRATASDPQILQARQLLDAGDAAAAERTCNRILAEQPDNAEAHNVLGGIALKAGRPDTAAGSFARAAALDPSHAGYQQGLGIAYFYLRRFPDAVRHFERAVELGPRDPSAHNNLGNCYLQSGDLVAAARRYRKAIRADSAYLPAYINLADVLVKRKKRPAAVRTYRKGLRIAGDAPGNSTNRVILLHRLGLALRELDKTDEAIECYRQAISIQPDFALAHNSLGGALLSRNELDDAMTCFRTALDLEPSWSRVHSNILLTMNYMAGMTQRDIYAESLRFDGQHARKLLDRTPFRNSRNKKKILRIGYLSPDFREHSVAHFTRKLLGQHDREAVTVYCYSDVESPDDLTGQFQAQSDHWLSIVEMTDDEVATRIREDGIDILVDLAGHTSNNRMLVFARKPGPIQVNWLGYPNTTGMRAMDYRLTDAVADPPGDADQLHAETLVRLENGFLCYQSDDSRAAVAPAPCISNGHVTFGSFNMIRKVTPEVVRLWSRIMTGTPGSRLLIKSHALEDEGTRRRLLDSFAGHGIDEHRLELLNSVPRRLDHINLYGKIDIGLDPFPYNGTTTTLEALWMGVPVIGLRGHRHAGCVGASILAHAGLTELVADDPDRYVELACELAGDRNRLVAFRGELRARLKKSPLMNVPLFTDALENEYRRMWVRWCDTAGRRAGR